MDEGSNPSREWKWEAGLEFTLAAIFSTKSVRDYHRATGSGVHRAESEPADLQLRAISVYRLETGTLLLNTQ